MKKLRIRGTQNNIIKVKIGRPRDNIILNEDKAFPVKTVTKVLSPLLFIDSMKSQTEKQGKRKK